MSFHEIILDPDEKLDARRKYVEPDLRLVKRSETVPACFGCGAPKEDPRCRVCGDSR
jgi:hypothetical protein